MTVSPLAFSLTGSFTQVGAVAGLAALLGIAILALLVFSQAREIKRLREWAGRAPERSAELEQRLSSVSAVRAQPLGGARPAPRATPVNVRATGTSEQASRVAPAASILAAEATAPTAQAHAPVSPAPPGTVPALEQPSGPQASPTAAEREATAETTAAASAQADTNLPNPSPTSQPTGEARAAAPASPPEQGAGTQDEQAPAETKEAAPAPTVEPVSPSPQPAPLTAAAAARSARPPLPPAPSRPASPGGEIGKQPAATLRSGQPMPARRTADPAIATPPWTAAGRPAEQFAGRRPPAVGSAQRGAYKHLRDEPARARRPRTIGVFAAVIVVVVALALALASLSGSKGSSTQRTSPPSTSGSSNTAHRAPSTQASPSPAGVSVAVLNGTEISGLAHRLAARLQEKGFTHANPLDSQPPSAYSQTVIEYASNHRAAADSVAKALKVSAGQVQPLEPSMASLSSGASVLVVAGSDQSSSAAAAGAGESGESTASPTGG